MPQQLHWGARGPINKNGGFSTLIKEELHNLQFSPLELSKVRKVKAEMGHWVQSIVSLAGRSWQRECRWEEAVLCLLWRWIGLTFRTSPSCRFCLKLAGENLSRKARSTGRSEPAGKHVLLFLPVPLCHQTGAPCSQCSSTVYYRGPENSKTNSHWQSIVTCSWKRPVLGTCPSSSEHQRARTAAFLWLWQASVPSLLRPAQCSWLISALKESAAL